MHATRLISAILTFVLLNLLFSAIFFTVTYLTVDGQEMTGAFVTTGTIAFFAFSLVGSFLVAIRTHKSLKGKGDTLNITYFFVVLLITLGVLSFFRFGSYIQSVN